MARSRSFSIFLLKAGFDDSNSLNEDGDELEDEVQANSLPAGATLLVKDSPPFPPWWRSYFDIQAPLNQVSKGALVFLPVAERYFVLAFGHVSHCLDSECYEHDFGIRVTLNCVDPKQLRSADSLDPGVGRRQRIQMPIGSDLTLLDFDRDSSILRRLTGKVDAEHAHLFKAATGASNLRIGLKLAPDELTELCTSLLELYLSDRYKESFPNIQDISPVRDPSLIKQLNDALAIAVREKDDGLSLTIPEMINYEEGLFATFRGAGPSELYSDVFIESYYDYLAECGFDLALINVDILRRHKLLLVEEDGSPRDIPHSIIKSLIFDCVVGGETFHLAEGNWYKVEPNYVAKLNSLLDDFCADLTLPDYNHTSEGAYNKDVAAHDASYVCLDTENISPAGETQVEPCDLYRVEADQSVFFHVKVSTLSSALSHHFNQGSNALELILLENDCLKKLRALIKSKVPAAKYEAFVAPLDSKAHKVVFAIVTHKSKAGKSLNLPLFARVSLRRTIRVLTLMKTPVEFGFVADQRPPKPKAKKTKKAA